MEEREREMPLNGEGRALEEEETYQHVYMIV